MATHYSEGFHQDVVEKKVLHFQCLLCFWVQIKTLIYKTQTHTDKANMATKFVNANVATLYFSSRKKTSFMFNAHNASENH